MANTLNGGAGTDTLNGGTGNDTYVIAQGEGADTIYEGGLGGTDILQFTGTTLTNANLTLAKSSSDLLVNFSGTLYATVTGYFNAGSEIETLKFSDGTTKNLTTIDWAQSGTSANNDLRGPSGFHRDVISGFAGDDQLLGYDGNDRLYGGDGNDTLYGGNHDDKLYGENNNDFLYGEAGNDYLNGGAGIDTMNGGLGADIFDFDAVTLGSNDIIQDFNVSQLDKLDIKDILVGYTAGQSLIDDFISFTTSGSNTIMAVDRDGTGTVYASQTVATLNSVTGLDADTLLSAGQLIAA